MSPPPERPKIYHITHVDNLPSILRAGWLFADSVMVTQGGPAAAIGMTAIKQRRLSLPVGCHPQLMVGACVPFYFCPRSIMLYILYRGDHPEVSYAGGQEPIVHLEGDFHAAVAWAQAHRLRWALSSSNAGARYARFHGRVADLSAIDWDAVTARDFRPAAVKEGKQAVS